MEGTQVLTGLDPGEQPKVSNLLVTWGTGICSVTQGLLNSENKDDAEREVESIDTDFRAGHTSFLGYFYLTGK